MSFSKIMVGMAMLICAGTTLAQNNLYQSKASQPFGDERAWNVYNPGTSSYIPLPGSGFPLPGVQTGDTVVIRNGHSIPVDADAAAKYLTVESGGTLTVSSGKSLTIENSGTVAVNSGATVNVTGGLYTPVSGTSTITSGSSVSVTGSFNAYGTVTDNDGVSIGSGGALNVYGTYNSNAAMPISSTGLLAIFGTFNANAGMTITSGGLIDVVGGTLAVSNTSISLPAVSLWMESTTSTLTLNLAAAIDLPASGSGVWVKEGTATFNGSGSLVGEHSLASIFIGPASGSATVQLTNNAVIRGSLIIQKYDVSYGTAIFSNGTSGYVIADGAYSGSGLYLDSSLNTLTARTNDSCGSANAQWQSVASGGNLIFDKAPSTDRYFYIATSATLTVNVQMGAAGINNPHGTVAGSQATWFNNHLSLCP